MQLSATEPVLSCKVGEFKVPTPEAVPRCRVAGLTLRQLCETFRSSNGTEARELGKDAALARKPLDTGVEFGCAASLRVFPWGERCCEACLAPSAGLARGVEGVGGGIAAPQPA